MNHYHSYMYYPYHGYWGHQHYPWPHYAYPYMPMVCTGCCQPAHLCRCAKPLAHMKVPQELAVDGASSPKTAFIGGLENVSLSLEYLKTGATPAIKIAITEAGQTTTWDITTIPDGYQIKENFASVAPGAEIEIDVTDCMARLRWCEVICC